MFCILRIYDTMFHIMNLRRFPMENCSRYFANKSCEYFPCHNGIEEFNCLFCYCPLYLREHCPGNPKYIECNGKTIKCCDDCTFPHQPENYDTIIKFLMK